MKLTKRILGLTTVGLIFIILLICFLFGGVGYGWHPYTYGPVGIILIVLVVLLITNNI